MRINDGMIVRAALTDFSKQMQEALDRGDRYFGTKLYEDLRDRAKELSELLTDSILDKTQVLSL